MTGSYLYQLDRKGRAVVHPDHRQRMGDELVVVAGNSNTVRIMSRKQWGRVLRQDPEIQAVSYPVMVDLTTGRILIPHALRLHAGLQCQSPVAMVGFGNEVRVMSEARWRHLMAAVARRSK